MHPWLLGILILALIVGVVTWRRARLARRAEFIRHFRLPQGLYARLQAKHPGLSRKDCELVAQGLRQFFLCHLNSGREYVSMPSQVADDLWHEFIVYTKNYQHFCRQAFGRFFHHTPAAVLSEGETRSNIGLRRCWTYACREENINPRAATRLPLLFALDTKLGIANGFRYVPDCSGVREASAGGTIHCGGEFGDSSIDGGTDGYCDSDGGGGDGDGGSGCGGGCGGD